MNKEMFFKVADAIEKEQDNVGFEMATWISQPRVTDEPGCGTTACVAGHAAILSDPTTYRKLNARLAFSSADGVREEAMKALGISIDAASHLFGGGGYGSQLSGEPELRKLVPDALRWMGTFGHVDWHLAITAARCVAEK